MGSVRGGPTRGLAEKGSEEPMGKRRWPWRCGLTAGPPPAEGLRGPAPLLASEPTAGGWGRHGPSRSLTQSRGAPRGACWWFRAAVVACPAGWWLYAPTKHPKERGLNGARRLLKEKCLRKVP